MRADILALASWQRADQGDLGFRTIAGHSPTKKGYLLAEERALRADITIPQENRSGPSDGSFLIPAPDLVGPAEDLSAGAPSTEPSPVAGSLAVRPTRRRRRDWKSIFIAVYRETGSVRQAAEAARVHRSSVYAAAARDSAFDADWQAAEQDFIDLLEAEATRRALNGSDRLLEHLLKSRRPEVYAVNYDMRSEVRAEVARIAAELGLPVDEVREAAIARAEELGR